MKTVYVVTISELSSTHENEVDVEAFANNDDAVAWVEKQIAEKIETYRLDGSDIDGWYIEIDGPTHTIQYDIRECVLR